MYSQFCIFVSVLSFLYSYKLVAGSLRWMLVSEWEAHWLACVTSVTSVSWGEDIDLFHREEPRGTRFENTL